MKRVSLKDIATAVGVSTATVSLVLSNKDQNGRVSKEMSATIKNVASQMNYQPNLLAKSLQSGSSKTIGLLVADITNSFFSQLVFYIQKEMQRYDYAVIIINTDEDSVQMERMISLLKSRQVDGFIIAPTESSDRLIEDLCKEKFPLVLLDRYFADINTCNVLSDNFKATHQATSYMIGKGCRKIAHMTYASDLIQVSERERGYAEAMSEAGIFDKSYIKRVRYTSLVEDVKIAMQELKEAHEPFDGILFATNSISLSGVRELMKDNAGVGEKMEIVCFDKNEGFEFLPIPISYIMQPIADIGRKAAELLMEQIVSDNNECKGGTHLMPCVLEY